VPAGNPKPGTFARPLISLLLAVSILLAAGYGCKDRGAPKISDKPDSAADARGRRGKKFSQPPAPVAVARARRGSISTYYTATTTREAEKEAQIIARVSGVIESIFCEEGDVVKKGSELLRVDNAEYRLKLSEAEAKSATLQDKYDRMKDMWKSNLVSEEEFNSVKNELKGAKATEELARLNLSYARVTAPFSGHIVQRLVDVGQNVSLGTALFVIADFDPLLAKVHVPSKEFKKLKPDQPVELILDSSEEKLEGRIKLVSPIIDPASGTIKVTIEIPEYPESTRPGDFAEVKIVTETRDGSLLVPKKAVFTDRGEQVVFVASGRTAERRVVDVGFVDDLDAEILSGVSDGELVVVKGQRSLRNGAPIKILEGEGARPGQAQKGTR
jgi:membrane fusion protein (multidrug efflux system)